VCTQDFWLEQNFFGLGENGPTSTPEFPHLRLNEIPFRSSKSGPESTLELSHFRLNKILFRLSKNEP